MAITKTMATNIKHPVSWLQLVRFGFMGWPQ
jgi:hypothetical protein